jgi:galactokinase
MNTGALAGSCVVVCNSMVKHSIASGEYGVRRREVEAGQAALRAAFPQVQDLGEATLQQLETCAASMPHESFLRCRHILNENTRVREAKKVMLAGNAVRLGTLITEAHASERDDFACSCDEVDFLVETAVQLPGCFGARLTGGGFGGCTVNLVAREQAEAFSESLKNAYCERFGIDAESYVCEAVDGAIARNTKQETRS